MSSLTSAPVPTSTGSLLSAFNGGSGRGSQSQGQSIQTFFASLGAAFVVFGIQVGFFLAFKTRFSRVYEPRTYLVPERERTNPPPKGPWQWLIPVFRTNTKDFIQKCGLDAYFFLRYLRMLLKIFIPAAFFIILILVPLNKVNGRGSSFVTGIYANSTTYSNVTGLDQLAWGNVRPTQNNRYWAHLILAVLLVIYVCFVFWEELRGYIRVRQAYLTSPQHRIRASATTVLVTNIPQKWLTFEALDGLYDVFPGGIRNIWINRNYDALSDKVKQRDAVAIKLEKAYTALVRNAKKAYLERIKKTGEPNKIERFYKAQAEARAEAMEAAAIEQEGAQASVTSAAGAEPEPSAGAEEAPPQERKEAQPSTTVAATEAQVTPKTSEPASLADRQRRIEFVPQMHPKEMNARPPWEEDEDDGEPTWKTYLKEKDRATMRLPVFGLNWMPCLPLVGKKVDVIDHCRKELARLNLEIEEDQREPNKFPLMNSAFIQFNNQVAAHMACQAVSHHAPNQMAPRLVEISPDDVIWDNMSIKWWESYLRTAISVALIIGLVIGWAIPVTFTGLLSQVRYLSETFSWLSWLGRTPTAIIAIIQGVLPQVLLAALLFLLPMILRLIVRFQGSHTGMAVEVSMQSYYFFFLFVQVFLVVSISSGITTVIQQITKSPQSVPSILAQNLPKASNYFFSYLLLQAMSTSAGALLQIWGLIQWFVMAPLFDKTARQRWIRQTNLPTVGWGTFFPVYTNLAAIGLIYSVISPLILIFCIVTFGLFWIVYRYNTLYVTNFRLDTGGLLFPKAINQLFIGLYVMELCLIGLFFLVRDVDSQGNAVGTPCKGQAIVMIIVFAGTILFQWLSNKSFSPLFRYLPITLEDEAVERDELFSLAQQKRWNGTGNEPADGDANEDQQEDTILQRQQHLLERRESFEKDFRKLHRKAVKLSRACDRLDQLQMEKVLDNDGQHDFEKPQSEWSDSEHGAGEHQDFDGVENLEEWQPRARKHDGHNDPGHMHNTSQTDLYGVSSPATRRRRKYTRDWYKRLGEHQGIAVEEYFEWAEARNEKRHPGARGIGFDGNNDRDDHDDLKERQATVEEDEAHPQTVEEGEASISETDDEPRYRPLERALGKPVPREPASREPAPRKAVPEKIGWAERSRKDWAARYPKFAHTYEIRERKHTRPLADLEAQSSERAGQALFSDIKDELEDLTIEERDKLVRRAFQHEALRSKRPVIWIPRDELGVSDDEVYRCQRFSKHIWISNAFAGLDGEGSVVFARPPPDFDEIDLIKL